MWLVVPGYAAAGKALEHPPWNAPGDPAVGGPFVDRWSWWPPGQRYEWTGAVTATRHRAVDPWGDPAAGHAWTAAVAVTTGVLVSFVLRGRRRARSATTPPWL